ncbi:MAG: prenyltransferase/squalene oxidase repeat-containing protein [Planctomycetota bacterium]
MRRLLLFLLILLPALVIAGPEAKSVDAETPDAPKAKPAAAPKVKELSAQGVAAIEKGLAWLAKHQNPDGSWTANVGYKLNETYVIETEDAGHPGVTALAGMAFLAGGHIPGRGKYGARVRDAVKFILKCVNSDGMITKNGSRMYSHAFGALFLAEVYGMTQDAKVRKALNRAAQFTFKVQNTAGGWRYAPYAQDSDMSITVCQVMALRAARNIGIRVPKESIDRAVNYVIESANTRPGSEYGSFLYQYRREQQIATRNSFALTAAGLATLYMAGLYSDRDIEEHIRKHKLSRYIGDRRPPRIESILTYIMRSYDRAHRIHRHNYFYYYGNYYAVQAMFTAGGERWERYFKRVQGHLVALQQKSGAWPMRRSNVGETYATASACLILQVPYRYLPIFER